MIDETIVDEVLERQLRSWMGTQWTDTSDAPLLGAVGARTRGLRQHRGVRAQLRRLGRPTPQAVRAHTRARRRTALVLMLLVAALLAALALSVGSRPADPVTPFGTLDIYPRLPDELPADATSGIFETSIGPARWVHLVGDLDSWPVEFRPLPGPTGLLALDHGGLHPECEVVVEETTFPDGTGFTKTEDCPSPPGLWSSVDGITWIRRPLPVANAESIDLVDGAYWLRSDDPTALWRSSDAVDWTEVNLKALEPPPLAGITWGMAQSGIAWSLEPGIPVTSNDTTIVPILWTAEVTQSIVAQTLALIDGTTAAPLTFPSVSVSDQGLGSLSFFAAPDGFRVFNPTPDGKVRVWHSGDGSAWQDEGFLHIDDAPSGDVSSVEIVSALGQAPLLVVYADDRAWESSDGLTWHAAELDPQGDRAQPVPGGWMSTSYGAWSVRAENGEWEPVEQSRDVPMSAEGNDGRIGDTYFNNVVGRVDGVPRQDLWFIQIDINTNG